MRILHTMLRVGDLQRSIDFYTKVLGMKLLRTSDNPEYKYTLAFLGYGSNPEHAELELTYNYGITLSEPHTAHLKKVWECRCGSPKCTGTMLQPKRKAKSKKA